MKNKKLRVKHADKTRVEAAPGQELSAEQLDHVAGGVRKASGGPSLEYLQWNMEIVTGKG